MKVSAGDCTLETTGPLNVSTGAGAIIVEHVAGDIDMSTGSGSIRIGRVDGNAEVKNSNGDINIGTITGALKAKTANGSVAVEHARIRRERRNRQRRHPFRDHREWSRIRQDGRRANPYRRSIRNRRAIRRSHVLRSRRQPDECHARTGFDRTPGRRPGAHQLRRHRHSTFGAPRRIQQEDLAKGTLMSRKPAITATGLKKAYDDKTVLDGIDISVDRGTVFALLGPNGAGKTTIVEILSTLVPAGRRQHPHRRVQPFRRSRRGAFAHRRHRAVLSGRRLSVR